MNIIYFFCLAALPIAGCGFDDTAPQSNPKAKILGEASCSSMHGYQLEIRSHFVNGFPAFNSQNLFHFYLKYNDHSRTILVTEGTNPVDVDLICDGVIPEIQLRYVPDIIEYNLKCDKFCVKISTTELRSFRG